MKKERNVKYLTEKVNFRNFNRSVEVNEYKGKKILHSLGNFCFGGSRSEENRTIVYRLWLTLTDGELTETRDEVVPCYLYSTLYKPTPITDKKDYDAVMAFLNGETETPLG